MPMPLITVGLITILTLTLVMLVMFQATIRWRATGRVHNTVRQAAVIAPTDTVSVRSRVCLDRRATARVRISCTASTARATVTVEKTSRLAATQGCVTFYRCHISWNRFFFIEQPLDVVKRCDSGCVQWRRSFSHC